MPTTRPSSVQDVKVALLALLDGEASFASAARMMGPPAEEPSEQQRVYVLQQSPREYSDLTDQGVKTESYTIPVFVEVRVYDDTRTACEAMAEDFAMTVCDLVEADRELGGACRDCTFETITGPVSGPADDGWIAQVTVDFRVESWL